MNPQEDSVEELFVQRSSMTEPLLQQNSILLRRSGANNTSQVAIIGSNACPIESLDYELIENDLFNQNWRSRGKAHKYKYVILKWTFCLLIGILVGAIGFFNNLAVENIAGFKLVSITKLMDSERYWAALCFYTGSNLVLVLFASAITAFISPAAGGSGIPEVKAYLNGVDAPNIFSIKTLIVKILGSIAAVSSSLHVGKAGSMVHIGACVAYIFGQGGSHKYKLTCDWLRYFKNDRDRRDLVTIGAGAGIAAAFRAPVGGLLFALESLSSWWRSALIWRTFFTTAVVAVVLRLLIGICNDNECGLFGKGGLIMYDVINDTMTYHMADLPPVILLGVTGGVLGCLYNFLMLKVLRLYSFINEKGRAHKLILASVISILISLATYSLPWLSSCRPCQSSDSTCASTNRFRQFQCPKNYYNDLASLFFNTNDDAIRNLYSTGTNDFYHPLSMLIFFISSYIFGTLSYGVVAPFGLFVPIILTGATYGRLVAILLGSYSKLDHGLVAILGSASFLGGTMRITVSVCIIILELTNNLLLLPLVMLVLLISKTVADSFNGNIYDMILQLKGLPYLEGHAEPYMRQLTVSDVVSGPLRVFSGVEKVGNIVHMLKTTGHHAFPVINEPPFSPCPVLYGLILRSHLLVVLKKKEYFSQNCVLSEEKNVYMRFSAGDFDKRGPGKSDSIDDLEFTSEEMEMFVDLHPFTNTSPYTVVETMSLAKALILFREVGLRHLLVVPKSSDRAPIVGILTRHDFMAEHILGLHPFLVKSKWKRLRWRKSTVTKYFRSFVMWFATT